MFRTLVAIGALVGLCDCTRNATLDIRIETPELPGQFDRLFLRASAEREDRFDATPAEESVLPEVRRLSLEPESYDLSLVTTSFADDVFLRVQLCRDERCAAPVETLGDGRSFPADPQGELWIAIERPFYQAAQTTWSIRLPDLPRCTNEDCSRTTDPGDLSMTSTSACASVDNDFPTWRCDIGRCDVACSAVEDLTAGFCEGGRSGRHFCE